MRERRMPWRKPNASYEAWQRDMRLTHIQQMLDAEPDKRLAMSTQREGDECILTIAIRGVAIFEMTMPWRNYDAFNLIMLINDHGGTIGRE